MVHPDSFGALVQFQQWATIKVNVIFYKDIKLCRKGNRNIDMCGMLSSEIAKVLLFTHLQVGHDRKMVTHLYFDPIKLLYFDPVINKNIIDTQHR